MFQMKKQETRYKPKKKMEFSKKWLIASMVSTSIIVIISFVCIIKSGDWCITDLSPITTICVAAFGQISVCSLFYFRKAQAENVIKLSKQIQNESIEQQNLEVANQIMNSNFTN